MVLGGGGVVVVLGEGLRRDIGAGVGGDGVGQEIVVEEGEAV